MAWKGSKASRLGEDFSNSGSAGTAEHRTRQTKLEVAKREANEAWEEMKKGQAPIGYVLVSPTMFFPQPLLIIMTGGRLRFMRARTQKARVLSPAEQPQVREVHP